MNTDTVTVMVKKSCKTIQECLDWANELVGNLLEPPHEWLIVTRIKQFQILSIDKAMRLFGDEEYSHNFVIVVLVEADDQLYSDGDEAQATADELETSLRGMFDVGAESVVGGSEAGTIDAVAEAKAGWLAAQATTADDDMVYAGRPDRHCDGTD